MSGSEGSQVDMQSLTQAQKAALESFNKHARKRKTRAKKTIAEVLQMSNISHERFDGAVRRLKERARIALHFHPDRPDPTMRSVTESLLTHGVYHSQFVTQLSSGSVSAFPGGARDNWERQLFDGAYNLTGSTDSDRPKYGALNLMFHPEGPAPRFGSCYFLLSPTASHRSTFTYLDSHQDPAERGTFEEFDDILAALLQEIFMRDFALGQHSLTPGLLVGHLLTSFNKPIDDFLSQNPGRNLNHYIEAQVHGDISLRRDVEILIADASFKGSAIGEDLERLCEIYHIGFYWHRGFELPVDEVPADFRGPTMPSLAERICENGMVNARLIGAAVVNFRKQPETWRDRGTFDEVLQEFKLLWHVLVKFGRPVAL